MRSCRIGLAVLIACAAPMWLGSSAGTTSSKFGALCDTPALDSSECSPDAPHCVSGGGPAICTRECTDKTECESAPAPSQGTPTCTPAHPAGPLAGKSNCVFKCDPTATEPCPDSTSLCVPFPGRHLLVTDPPGLDNFCINPG